MTDSQRQAVPEGESLEDADVRFAEGIRARRVKLKMSLKDVAGEMGRLGKPRDAQTVHKDETGNRKISVGEAEAYARVLGTTVSHLIMPTEEQNTAAFLDEFAARAGAAFEEIAGGTQRMLFAREHLERGIAAAAGKNLESERVRAAVREAHQVLGHCTPERAVGTGRQDFARDYGEGRRGAS